MNKIIFLIIIILFSFFLAKAQKINNINVSEDDKKLIITYSIEDFKHYDNFFIELYYSLDGGRNFKGPVKQATGDIGPKVLGGYNKRVTWSALEEISYLESDDIIFRIKADVSIDKSRMSKYELNALMKSNTKCLRVLRNVSMPIAVAGMGLGSYFLYKSFNDYKKYDSATSEAESLRKSVQLADKMYPAIYAVAGAGTVVFLISQIKISNKKKTFSYAFIPNQNGFLAAFTKTF